jgi:hypothetical protein
LGERRGRLREKFEFVINLQTTLGIEISPTLIALE